MAASHFKKHPQGEKPSQTKKTHPKHDRFTFVNDFPMFDNKHLNILPLRPAQKQKTKKKL